MSKKRRQVSQFVGGQAFFANMTLAHVKFVIYIFILIIVYISIHYASEKTLREVRDTDRELKALRAQYTSKNAALMFLSQQKEVEKQLEIKGSNLKAPVNPPQWIKEVQNE